MNSIFMFFSEKYKLIGSESPCVAHRLILLRLLALLTARSLYGFKIHTRTQRDLAKNAL